MGLKALGVILVPKNRPVKLLARGIRECGVISRDGHCCGEISVPALVLPRVNEDAKFLVKAKPQNAI